MLVTLVFVGYFFPPPQIENLQSISLCEALEIIKPEEKMEVIISGFYHIPSGWENNMGRGLFFDADEPQCQLAMSSYSCVEFSPIFELESEFKEILIGGESIYVTLHGTLYGEWGAPQPFWNNKPQPKRYQPFSGYCPPFDTRTKLIIDSVLSFDTNRCENQEIEIKDDFWTEAPFPLKMSLPKYSKLGIFLQIEGTVVLSVTIANGLITQIRPKIGNEYLLKQAISDIKSWVFESNVNDSFDVKFEYQLEMRNNGENKNPHIIMDLPYYVKVIGPFKNK